jgi:hypothetical protein
LQRCANGEDGGAMQKGATRKVTPFALLPAGLA